MKDLITKRIEREKVIATANGIFGDDCVKLASALYNGGIKVLELHLSTDNHAQISKSIHQLQKEFGDTLSVGLGNVLSLEDIRFAKDTGAKFASSPITDIEVIRSANELGLVIIPGALTPTEIVHAHRNGADFVKVYPAGSMGPAYFHHIQPVIKNIPVLAQGGITRPNVRLYKNAGVTGFFVDDCLYTRELIEKQNWQEITDTSKTFNHTL